MSAGCSPSEVRAECAARGLSESQARQTLELIDALVAGHGDGKDFSTWDEPPRPAKGNAPPPENQPRLELVDPAGVAGQALRAVEPYLAPWKASFHSEHQPAAEILGEIGSEPLDFFGAERQSQLCERLAERPLSATPEYFSPLLIQIGAEEILHRFAEG